MGNPFMLQACLRLDPSQIPANIEIGKEYSFSKEGHRLYQLEVPMDLRTKDWKFLGRCIVTEYKIGHGKTEGKFVVVKLFSREESKVIDKCYISDEEVREIIQESK